MREDAIQVEETRLEKVTAIEDYPDFHERHRVFPAVFENRNHKRILDVAAGVGCAAKRIHDNYPAELTCNDITPKCLSILNNIGLNTVSFDLDNEEPFPFPDGHFDAIVALATIEHMIHIDHFVSEIHRMLSEGGYLYMTTPNYAALAYFPRFVLKGETFHNPLSESSRQRYEFYAHVRYLTYQSMIDYVNSFGVVPDTVYLPLPEASTRFRALPKPKALAFRFAMNAMYHLLSPRWASEPIVCFRKVASGKNGHLRKVIL